MAYDRMDWHYGAEDFPSDLEPEAGGTHIGMFLAWAIQNDFSGNLHTEESQESIQKVKNREMTGTEFLIKECDEKFWEIDLNEIGNQFAKFYYQSDLYLTDYESAVGSNLPSLYHVADTWENFDKISKLISSQFSQWKNQQK